MTSITSDINNRKKRWFEYNVICHLLVIAQISLGIKHKSFYECTYVCGTFVFSAMSTNSDVNDNFLLVAAVTSEAQIILSSCTGLLSIRLTGNLENFLIIYSFFTYTEFHIAKVTKGSDEKVIDRHSFLT